MHTTNILAGTHAMAREVAHFLGIAADRWHYVHNAHALLGRPGSVLIIGNMAHMHRYYMAVIGDARRRGFQVCGVDTDLCHP